MARCCILNGRNCCILLDRLQAYIDKLNKDIFPQLDFEKLHESCNADLQYAKDVLKNLHDAFVDVYQTDSLSDRDFEFVLVPAVIQAEKTGTLSLGILTLDIASSGEHWGTIFFTDQGLIDGNDPNLPSAGKDYIRATFAADHPSDATDYRAFVGCFVHYEERTRTVVDENGREKEERFTVAVPLQSLPDIYSNLEKP